MRNYVFGWLTVAMLKSIIQNKVLGRNYKTVQMLAVLAVDLGYSQNISHAVFDDHRWGGRRQQRPRLSQLWWWWWQLGDKYKKGLEASVTPESHNTVEYSVPSKLRKMGVQPFRRRHAIRHSNQPMGGSVNPLAKQLLLLLLLPGYYYNYHHYALSLII